MGKFLAFLIAVAAAAGIGRLLPEPRLVSASMATIRKCGTTIAPRRRSRWAGSASTQRRRLPQPFRQSNDESRDPVTIPGSFKVVNQMDAYAEVPGPILFARPAGPGRGGAGRWPRAVLAGEHSAGDDQPRGPRVRGALLSVQRSCAIVGQDEIVAMIDPSGRCTASRRNASKYFRQVGLRRGRSHRQGSRKAAADRTQARQVFERNRSQHRDPDPRQDEGRHDLQEK